MDENNYTGTLTSSTTYQVESCGCRLPCGVCLMTNKPCPFAVATVQPTWADRIEITCKTGEA